MKYFKCKKCDWQTACGDKQAKPQMKCGVVVGWAGDSFYGCNGILEEISYEEAMSNV